MERKQDTKDEEYIRWHNAFCAATELELADNVDVLEFHREYILGKEPLKIDMLVVHVSKGAVLKNEIARDFFRGHNVIEYKSPEDEANIDTVYKILAYAALYKAETGKYVDAIKDDDITMTIMREAKPLKLFKVLMQKGCRIVNRRRGIYEVQHTVFPLQIIVTKELDGEDHIWLRSLTRKLTLQDARRLSHQYRSVRKTGTKADRQNAETVMELVSRASDIELVKDEKEDGIMTIMDVAGPVIEEEREKAREEREKAREWLLLGMRNMAETYFQFGQPQEAAQKAVAEKYPDAGVELIHSIIANIYGERV